MKRFLYRVRRYNPRIVTSDHIYELRLFYPDATSYYDPRHCVKLIKIGCRNINNALALLRYLCYTIHNSYNNNAIILQSLYINGGFIEKRIYDSTHVI